MLHHRRLARGAFLAAAVGVAVTLAAAPAAVAGPAAASTARSFVNVIVTLEPTADSASVAAELLGPLGGRLGYVYSNALRGFSASLPTALVSTLLTDARVTRVELDGVMRASTTQFNPPSWGLDRIDQRATSLSGSYTYTATGAFVTAYVIDTGITLNHPDFGGRATSGFDAIDGGSADDCHGHGTHVAGTIGGTAYGVAKSVNLRAVRVLDCAGSGTNSQVIAGIDYVVGNHSAGQPAVANMSLGGSASSTIDAAVNRMIDDGIAVAVAGGNENTDACRRSPARVPRAMTAGASDINDARASFSNSGNCIDWFAPGVNIKSDWLNGGTNTISGTSMASPHVAGVAALYLQGQPTATPAQVTSALASRTTKDIVTNTGRVCSLLILCTPATPNNDMLFTDF